MNCRAPLNAEEPCTDHALMQYARYCFDSNKQDPAFYDSCRTCSTASVEVYLEGFIDPKLVRHKTSVPDKVRLASKTTSKISCRLCVAVTGGMWQRFCATGGKTYKVPWMALTQGLEEATLRSCAAVSLFSEEFNVSRNEALMLSLTTH